MLTSFFSAFSTPSLERKNELNGTSSNGTLLKFLCQTVNVTVCCYVILCLFLQDNFNVLIVLIFIFMVCLRFALVDIKS